MKWKKFIPLDGKEWKSKAMFWGVGQNLNDGQEGLVRDIKSEVVEDPEWKLKSAMYRS